MGHTNIYHSTGPLGNQIANDRLAGYLQAMQDYKLHVTDDHLVSCGSMFDDGYWCMKRVIGRQQLPTAMLFHNDITAYGAIQACREEHIKVPEDLSMIGIDHLASMTDFGGMIPDLTTITMPIMQYGIHAAHLLIGQIENDSLAQNVVLPCSLYKGSTVRHL
ncbi:MAG: substrate-binding domain-containing protein [Raoultibacter sp.]